MKPGTKVKVHYTGNLDDGSVFDSSNGKGPLEFIIGEGQVIQGFEDAVKDMKLNDEKTVKIKSEDAYGGKNHELIFEVPRDKFPPELKSGGKLILKGEDGQHHQAIIEEITQEKVKIDLNHPLAGKDLTFKIKVIEIN